MTLTDDTLVTRRTFTLEAALAMLAGVTISITGCGGDDGPTSPSPQPGGRTGSISANHGHTAQITAAEITAGNALALDIRGQADHPHTVTISQAELNQIASGQRVEKESTNNQAHTHFVTFN